MVRHWTPHKNAAISSFILQFLTFEIIWTLLAQNGWQAFGTKTAPPPPFAEPNSEGLDSVDLLIGTTGETPNTSGGMIPSTAPPFGMTRWVAQTQVSYVSATPYNASWGLKGVNDANRKIHGFIGTRQPAIWMGESGSISVIPGVVLSNDADANKIKPDFETRGLPVITSTSAGEEEREEVISPGYYNVLLDDAIGDGGRLLCEMSATSRVGHLRFTFTSPSRSSPRRPYILIEVARPSIITSTPSNVTFPPGHVTIHPQSSTSAEGSNANVEICGHSTERQDSIITPISGQAAASGFKGYFCARIQFSAQSLPENLEYGIIQNGTVHPGKQELAGPLLSAYVFLPTSTLSSDAGVNANAVDVRVGTSFISIEQAKKNVEVEVPDVVVKTAPQHTPGTLEWTAHRVRSEWATLLNRISIDVGSAGEGSDDESKVMKEVFWTAVVHTLQYPSEQHEQNRYYSGYDNSVHVLGDGGESYTGYSIWDTYRAHWAWQILFVPERVTGMVESMLADFKESGWLPMWKNIVETNIMVGTHADSLIAEAVLKNITGFDRELAWEAVWKDSTVAPERDWEVQYDDREEHVDYEVRAGLSSVYNVEGKGWVADDIHSESASRTLDYAYDDYAAFVLARELRKSANVTEFLHERATRAPFTLFNDATGFMEARNANGSWAGEDRGWTEGDKWAYSFDVVHDVPELIKRRGGKVRFVQSLEDHFEGGHNDHTNEPSHHIPYLYALAGAAFKAQERVREIAKENYNNKPDGLTGNEDCGQMSAWYIFSAMGFYPVNPVSGEYVVGSPFFEKISIEVPVVPNNLDSSSKLCTRTLVIRAPGARTKPYIKSLTINGIPIESPVIRHDQIVGGEGDVEVVFEMSDKIAEWGNDVQVLEALGVEIGDSVKEQRFQRDYVEDGARTDQRIGNSGQNRDFGEL